MSWFDNIRGRNNGEKEKELRPVVERELGVGDMVWVRFDDPEGKLRYFKGLYEKFEGRLAFVKIKLERNGGVVDGYVIDSYETVRAENQPTDPHQLEPAGSLTDLERRIDLLREKGMQIGGDFVSSGEIWERVAIERSGGESGLPEAIKQVVSRLNMGDKIGIS